ncbi:CMGC protein kinase [Xylona heveae TC161]|uniref:non-specific serine/threonine protein kinase n=1 Tax=Xylona heveae (strain CBS 132557 / TC161) TaxID=1328760 RepID=A0A165GSL7_XYLHT|nr:CMGC protein kinase [Xylona heveae TC161]KZF22544.1 CMGC protein kinase [Xylona heveae TC161]
MGSSQPPRILPADELVEEERVPGYRPELYYPATPGQVLNSRYKILTKIGWGRTSTVWLAQELDGPEEMPFPYVTLKLTTADPDFEDVALHELNMNKYLTKDTYFAGSLFVRAAFDHFMATSPTGTEHLCLVFDAMREPLSQFKYRLPGGCIPPSLLKVYAEFILQGLEYLHSHCQIVHTDLKTDNILMSFEDVNVVEEYVKAQDEHPMPRKTIGDRTIYLSHNNFGDLRSYWVLPRIADFGLAHHVDGKRPLRHPIQPPLYHAPEVLLGAPWSYSADIWNLGVLLFELLENRQLFRHLESQKGVYTAQAHLAEMIALFGPPPQKLIEQEKQWCDVPWDRSFPGPDGTWYDTAREYYGGPFFDSKGHFTHTQIIPKDVRLDDCVTCLTGKEKELFLNFVRKMLRWLPEERKTAKELREDPWLYSDLDKT